MSEFMMNAGNGTSVRAIRNDAIKMRNPDRWYVPTSEQTKWVSTWAEFKAAGGTTNFSEDQGEIELLLPAPFKFSIQFMRQQEGEAA